MEDSTKGIRLQTDRTSYREHSSPIFMTSSFIYDNAEHAEEMFKGEGEGDIYSRFSNPNTSELIQKLCAMEQAEDGIVTASGMAAIFNTLAAHLQQGDHLVASNSLFGNSTYIINHILPQWGINCTLVDINDKEGWINAISPKTRMVFIETPSNPGLELIDISWLSKLCRPHKAILVVDNCFATPILQKPLLLGADISIHSATKWIDGQGRTLGGAVVGKKEVIAPIFDFLRRTGASMSPFNAWILSKSLETLQLRMQRHCDNAHSLADFLQHHDKVAKVKYPFLKNHPHYSLAKKQMTMGGGIVTVDLAGGKTECFNLINNLKMLSITANLGDSRTIITHPSTTTHSKLSNEEKLKAGISDSTLRISVGLEHIDDIIADIVQAFK